MTMAVIPCAIGDLNLVLAAKRGSLWTALLSPTTRVKAWMSERLIIQRWENRPIIAFIIGRIINSGHLIPNSFIASLFPLIDRLLRFPMNKTHTGILFPLFPVSCPTEANPFQIYPSNERECRNGHYKFISSTRIKSGLMLLSPQKGPSQQGMDFSLLQADANEVAKNIFIGDQKCAKNYLFLKSLGIKHIVVAGQQLCPNFPETFNYLHVKVKDSPKENISAHFSDVCEFITAAVRKKEGVLVHCAYGVSRSATLAIAFLMKMLRISYLQAFVFVRRKRPVIKPNSGFEQQLKKWGSMVSK